MDKERLAQELSQFPLYVYAYVDPQTLEFSNRIRHICKAECPMYGKTWACPPAVGDVDACRQKCLSYDHCLLIGSVAEVEDIANIDETLATRPEHEVLTNQVRDLLRAQGIEPYVLSTEACTLCDHCAYLEGTPCRHPELMHPCVESHGINIIPTLEQNGLEFQYGSNVITWFSLLFFHG